MVRARSLAGVAAIAVACALPSSASAQIGACPALLPPPCIVNDPSKIAGIVAEIKEKKGFLEKTIQQVEQMTGINGVLGLMNPETQSANDPITAIVPPISTGQDLTFSEAANQLSASLSSHDKSLEGQAEAARDDKLRMRAAAGEGYATALAIKARQAEFDAAYQDLFSRAAANASQPGQTPQPGKLPSSAEQLRVCRSMGAGPFKDWRQNILTGGAGKAESLEQDWEVNAAAKMLLLNAYMLKREAMTARLQLVSMTSINSKIGAGSGKVTYSDAAPPAPLPTSKHNVNLGELIKEVAKLYALKSAVDTAKTLILGINGTRETQAEYQEMVRAKNSAQAAVQNIANSDSRRKGISAASLISRADQIMQARDRTTWDDPSKKAVTESAAKYAEDQLDRMVSGDVNDNWSNLLIKRAEAFKQEAFFRDINKDAIAAEADGKKALETFNASIGVNSADQAAIQSAIAQAQARVTELSAQLDTAPADIVSLRDRALSAVVAKAPGQPPTN